MMAFVRQGQRKLQHLAMEPIVRKGLEGALHFGAGFLLSAAGLGQHYIPLGAGFVLGNSGWGAILSALGASAGYLYFWSAPQGVAWVSVALLLSALLKDRALCKTAPLLLPVTAALTVALSGVIFQSMGRDCPPVTIYILRVLFAGATAALYTRVMRERVPLYDWFAWGFAVLALAQIMPLPYLGLGYIAAGALVVRGAFPAAALGGLALDLAGITPLPMTAIVCFSYLIRFLPKYPQWFGSCAVTLVAGFVMYITGEYDMYVVPGLFLGAALGTYLPSARPATYRRGETGLAQVRLELASGVLAQTAQLLEETPAQPVDEDALVARAAEAACGGCPCRRSCKDVRRLGALPGLLLHKPLIHGEELPIVCKKSGRFLAELHRSQEQLRSILADRERQREYRTALLQQYHFLSGYLQELSDTLTRRSDSGPDLYRAEVQVYSNRGETGNGDRCIRFSGPGGRYYVLLCDGMGTGPGAAMEAKTGGELLRHLLTAGYPAEHALGCFNSLCALRDRAGAVTVDMVEIRLDTGGVTLYKWGAAPSYLFRDRNVEKIGTPTPPPGLSVEHWEQQPRRVRLRRGQRLVLVSDGVGEAGAFRICRENMELGDEELAQRLISYGHLQGEDDATVVCIRLKELST